MAKYGVRECCDVVFKAKTKMTLGTKTFYPGEPVLYFDTLKTNSLEGQSSTSYATGGRGGARLLAFDGEKTLTFNMEDALIAPEGIAILAGADLIETGKGTENAKEKIYVHVTKEISKEDITDKGGSVTISNGKVTVEDVDLGVAPYQDSAGVYPIFMFVKDEYGYIVSEPFSSVATGDQGKLSMDGTKVKIATASNAIPELVGTTTYGSLLFDFYVEKTSGVKEIDIAADKFGGNFYIEGSTLWKDQATGRDDAAEIIIPNGKIQTNFTFTMAGTGDPSSFSFTVDALRGKLKNGKDVLAAIQIINSAEDDDEDNARKTTHNNDKYNVGE